MSSIKVKPKFAIGDVVEGRKTGTRASGVVCAVIHAPEYYRSINIGPKQKHGTWDDLYPDWVHKYVYWVKLDNPSRPISFDEFCMAYDLEPDDPRSTIKYEEIGLKFVLTYPEDDMQPYSMV
jgi:hypothetical protein